MRGYQVEPVGGAGIAPGARLNISKGKKKFRVAVRSALDRKVGFSRASPGGVKTLPHVDVLVVSSPSPEQPNCAEVLCFSSRDVANHIDKHVFANENSKSDKPAKAPIFLPLDSHERAGKKKEGLKGLSKWSMNVPLSAVSIQMNGSSESVTDFVKRVKREFAETFGAEEKTLDVQILIK